MAGSSQIAQRTKLCLTDMDDNGAALSCQLLGTLGATVQHNNDDNDE